MHVTINVEEFSDGIITGFSWRESSHVVKRVTSSCNLRKKIFFNSNFVIWSLSKNYAERYYSVRQRVLSWEGNVEEFSVARGIFLGKYGSRRGWE